MTEQQFADVAAQEMHRAPGEDLDLSTVLEAARGTRSGPGRYESLHLVGELEGQPVLTFTSPEIRRRRAPTRRREPYLAMVAQGLRETHDLTDDELADYLLQCPGVSPDWDASRLADLVSARQRGA